MKGDNIAARLRTFAASTIRLTRRFPREIAARHVARQLVRSATGGGSNYEEARGAESLADFIHKLGIANKELRESLYWLLLSQEVELVEGREIDGHVAEAKELIAILTSSIRTSKQREMGNGEAKR